MRELTHVGRVTIQILPGPLAAAVMSLPAGLTASPLPMLPVYVFGDVVTTHPGDVFDGPAPGIDGVGWLVDVAGLLSVPTAVVDFTVTNVLPVPVMVQTFEVFGNCTGQADGAWRPSRGLSINGTPARFTVDPDVCRYHDDLDFVLQRGTTRFAVALNDLPTSDARFLDVRSGTVIPAFLPPPAGRAFLGRGPCGAGAAPSPGAVRPIPPR